MRAAAAGLGGCSDALLEEHFSLERLRELDSEGRAVVTDHGAFVLFNLYGPAITNEETAEERMAFKLHFYKVPPAPSVCCPCGAVPPPAASSILLPLRLRSAHSVHVHTTERSAHSPA
jgi:hypothetical protein